MSKFPRRERRHLSPLVFGMLVVSISAVLACLPEIAVHAQDDNSSAIHVNSNLVMLDATVKTKAGAIMGDLKQGDFEIREDGAAQKIALFSRDELPLNVHLCSI